MTYCTEYNSPVGILFLESDGHSLTGLWMDRRGTGESCPVLDRARLWLDDYFRGSPREVDFPLNPRGTPFQKAVWDILLTIPYGETTTYGAIAREMARRLGKERMSAQAVGGAVGRNPISVIIPCHRVVGTDGSLTGYAWGVAKKKWLLAHEKNTLPF